LNAFRGTLLVQKGPTKGRHAKAGLNRPSTDISSEFPCGADAIPGALNGLVHRMSIFEMVMKGKTFEGVWKRSLKM
jgi:hypothetical protein|tara:strand:+ start:540 stop:767 length:228 start_codon:yes stop_codon:yes gene_type:complete